MSHLQQARLYAFIDTAYLRGRDPAAIAGALCRGGADVVQLRAKSSSLREVRRMARSVLAVTRPAGVPLIVNDHWQIALEVGADGCHLGQEDFFGAGHRDAETMRRGQALMVGLSTHAPDQARRALDAGPDYIAIGPVYATGTKPDARPVTLDYVRWASREVKGPWFAIGGITLENVAAVAGAGGRRVGVVSGILNAPDPAEACQAYRRRLLSAPSSALDARETGTGERRTGEPSSRA